MVKYSSLIYQRIRFFGVLCLLSCAFPAIANHVKVQNFEGEIDLGLTWGLSIPNEAVRGATPCFSLELRYNIKESPFACGLMISSYSPYRYHSDTVSLFGDMRWCGGMLYGITGEYNLRRGKKFNPFGGISLGLGSLSGMHEKSQCMPFGRIKVGVEFIHHIRLGAELTLTQRDLCGVSANIGFVIGGRPKRNINKQ